MENQPERWPVSVTLQLQFADFRIDVETNSLRLAGKLQSYFSGYLAVERKTAGARLRAIVGPAEYDDAKMEIWSRASTPNRLPKESFYDAGGTRRILKNRTGVLITVSEAGATITGELDEHSNQVINLIGTMFGLSLLDKRYVMVHASAIVDANGEALVFLGNSGSGKSSLALQLIERGGFEYLSNDRVLMRVQKDEILVAGLPKKPRVNPGTLLASESLSRLVPRPRRRAYARLAREELWKLEEKTDVDVQQDLGARSRLQAPLGRIYSLEWRPGGSGLEQRQLDADDALTALLTTAKDFGPYDLHGAERRPQRTYSRIARLATCIGVTGRADPPGFAKKFGRASSPSTRRA
jgi:HprK-related kinase B